MPRTTLALTNFVSGELSPKMDGRIDFEKYSSGAKTLENMLNFFILFPFRETSLNILFLAICNCK